MRYAPTEYIIEAFRIGVDNIPDWFMDMVTADKAVLHKDCADNTYAEFIIDGTWVFAPSGHYIARDSDGLILEYDPEYFKKNFSAINKVEPVNAAKPVDPEKERFDALDEHYTSLAREIKLAYDCFIKAGFHPNDAFTLLMKLMENPIKPPKRSKEDVIREFNKWRAERKERVNNDSRSVSERCD